MIHVDVLSERILILAPRGRDAPLAQALLSEAGIRALSVATLSDLLPELEAGAAATIVAEEAVATADLAALSRWIEDQPAWSDLAFIVLTRQGGGLERNPTAARLSKVLGNVTFLERPFHPTTLISLIQTALRGRRRQYDARTRLEELRNSEERLQDLNASLEHRVAREVEERAAAEEALRQSQKMEAVGQLTGGVAHDFNNLLTIIRSSVDLLRRPGLDEARRQRYMDAVVDTIDRAAKLTSQLLAFARRQTLHAEAFDVAERLQGIAEMLDTVIGARVQIQTIVEHKPLFVKADVSQFETTIVNMAVNARDAMDGYGTLTLRVQRANSLPPSRVGTHGDGPFAVISVSDTGTGIAPGDIGKIFEPFYTTKEVGKGTGLGLSQVFGFAKQSGGDVAVESELGSGTTFRMYLPQVDPPAEPAVRDAAIAQLTRGDGRQVLIVEDNRVLGQFAAEMLRDLGYATTLATNAEEALDHLGRKEPAFDVVFSDVVMPGMSGIDLANHLKDVQPDLPIILASGYNQVMAREGTLGFDLLRKPYSADQLSAALQRAIGRKLFSTHLSRE